MNETTRAQLKRYQMAALALGVTGLACCVLAAATHAGNFFAGYLFGFLFWMNLSLGCFCVAMIHHLTGGRWGNATRRFLEAGFMTLPLMAVLFVPILFGLSQLYPWARPAEVAIDKVLQHRAVYMNVPAFMMRAAFSFVVWIVMAVCLRKWSVEQDETTDAAPTRRLRTLSGPGVIIYTLTVTLAYTDWVMSLEPDWYSTMFIVIICAGQILTAFAFIIILLSWFKNDESVAEAASPTTFHHLGNLLLAFVIFWTYVAYGQFLIIWSGNLPEEIKWYMHRVTGDWKWLVVFLAVFHFFLPFFLLLFRATKKKATSLAFLAAMVMIAHIADVYWLIFPSFSTTGIEISWPGIAAFFGVGGVWVAVFIALLQRRALLPRNDPRMQPALAHAK